MDIVEIEKLVYNGHGIGKLNNKVIFLDYVLPGEKVSIEIIKNKKFFSFGKIVDILTVSNERVQPVCSKFFKCGGCQWQHIQYSSQLYFKKEIVKEALLKIAGLNEFPEIIVISSEQYNYRNKVKFHVKNSKLGFFSRNSHEFIPIESCPVLCNEINEYIKDYIPRDLKSVDVFSNKKGEILTNDSKKKFIFEEIIEYKFRISRKSFFQGNRLLTEKLLELVLSYSFDSEKIADLYSGVGLFTIPLSKACSKCIGIEVAKASFTDAMENIKKNKINNIRLYNRKVEEAYDILKKFAPDLIVCDPPRAGINKILLKKISDVKSVKRLIYVSCNPITFCRDLKILKNNFELKKIFLIDMFPNTYHIEIVAIFDKNNF